MSDKENAGNAPEISKSKLNDALGVVVTHDGSSPAEVSERCCVCRTPTKYWYGAGERNVALCQSCAKTVTPSDLPTKSEWCAKERSLMLPTYP